MDFTNTFHVQFDIKINLDTVAFIQSMREYYDERATIFVVSSEIVSLMHSSGCCSGADGW